MSNLVEKKLSSGWEVRVRPVPPLAGAEVLDMSRYIHPPVPMQEVETKVSTEYVSYAASHPEMWEWRQKCEKLDEQQFEDKKAFAYHYGVHSWRRDGKKWLTEPPEGWEVDSAFVKLLYDGSALYRRLAFIKTELALSPDDVTKIQEVIYSIRSVSSDDMDAIEQLFRSPIQLRAVIELLDRQLQDNGELAVS